jgi:hypothetical protein
MAATMTPLDFAKKYYNLDVYLFPQEVTGTPGPYTPPEGWRTLRADNYRLGGSAWSNTFWSQDIAPHFRDGPIKVCVWSMNNTLEEIEFRNPNELNRHYRAPFVGKGSPEQVQIAIQLVYRFRKVSTPVEQFVRSDFVGLDCNGFVGGYYQKVVKGEDWKTADVNKDPGPTTLMDDLLKLGDEVYDPKDLTRDGTYILVWCDAAGNIKNPQKGVPNSFGHVMITEPNTLTGTPGDQKIHVVEATASDKRKLRDLDYTIKSSNRVNVGGRKATVFRVERGAPGDLMDVRISRLKV